MHCIDGLERSANLLRRPIVGKGAAITAGTMYHSTLPGTRLATASDLPGGVPRSRPRCYNG